MELVLDADDVEADELDELDDELEDAIVEEELIDGVTDDDTEDGTEDVEITELLEFVIVVEVEDLVAKTTPASPATIITMMTTTDVSLEITAL